MPSATLYPAVSSDNGYANNDNEFYSGGYGGSYLEAGRFVTNIDRVWLRFSVDGIPIGSTVTAATLSLVAYQDLSGATAIARVSAVAADDSAAPTTSAATMALTSGAQYVDWTMPGMTAGTSYSPPDLAAIIQEFIDRPGYAPGAHIVLLLSGDASSTNAYRAFDSLSYSGGAYKPALALSWTEPDPTLANGGITISGFSVEGDTSGASNVVCSGEVEISGFSVSGYGARAYSCLGEIVLSSAFGGYRGIEVSGFCGSTGDMSISGMTLDGTASAGTHGDITLPPFSVLGVCGSTAEATISAFSVLGTGNPPASGEITILPFLVEGTAKIGVVSRGSVDIAAFGVYGSSYLGILGEGTAAFKLRVLGTAKIGRLARGAVTISSFSVSGQTSEGNLSNGSVEFPPVIVSGVMVDPSQFSKPLAYDQEVIR